MPEQKRKKWIDTVIEQSAEPVVLPWSRAAKRAKRLLRTPEPAQAACA